MSARLKDRVVVITKQGGVKISRERRWPKYSWAMGHKALVRGISKIKIFPDPFSTGRTVHPSCDGRISSQCDPQLFRYLTRLLSKKLEGIGKRFGVNRNQISPFSFKLIFQNCICKIIRTHLCSEVFASSTDLSSERKRRNRIKWTCSKSLLCVRCSTFNFLYLLWVKY